LAFLKENGIFAVFHYLSLHKSEFYKNKHDNRILKHCDFYSETLIRLPFYYELTNNEINEITEKIKQLFE